jgi:hypothetical protein
MKTRIHPADIEALIDRAEIHTETIFDKVTLVAVRLESGFVLTESSGAVDQANYSEDQGKEICLEKIRSQLWKMEGYHLQKTIHRGEPKLAT